jgi:hypothetical protein
MYSDLIVYAVNFALAFYIGTARAKTTFTA